MDEKIDKETLVYLGMIGIQIGLITTVICVAGCASGQDVNIAKTIVDDAKEYHLDLQNVVTFDSTSWSYDQEEDKYKVAFVLTSYNQLEDEKYRQKIVYATDKAAFEKFIEIKDVHNGKEKLKLVQDFCNNENNKVVEYWFEADGLWIKSDGKLAEEMANSDNVDAKSIINTIAAGYNSKTNPTLEAIAERHAQPEEPQRPVKVKGPKNPHVR